MKVTYYGHSCFAVEIGGKHLLFDPFISPNPLAKEVHINKIPADYILVSHGHDDHMADAVKIAKCTQAMVIANYEVALWLEKKGAPKVHALNPGGALALDVARVKFVTAVHSSSMPNGAYGGVAGGFVVESSAGNFYYSGDTALTYDMRLIGETTRLKFAVLCVGGNFTMDMNEAVRAAEFVQCHQVLGVHYDTFPEIVIDHARARERFQTAGRTLHLLQIGEVSDL